MRQLHAAGMRIWVLTGVFVYATCSADPVLIGDKIATAINISISAGHMTQHTVRLCTYDS